MESSTFYLFLLLLWAHCQGASLWHLCQAPSLGQQGLYAQPPSWKIQVASCVSFPVFIGCLLVSAPVFGYLGDRHSRKATLSFGILLWSGAGLSSSFISYQVGPHIPAQSLGPSPSAFFLIQLPQSSLLAQASSGIVPPGPGGELWYSL